MVKSLIINIIIILIVYPVYAEKMNSQWISVDYNNYINLHEALKYKDNFNVFISKLINTDIRNNESIGFNSKRIIFSQHGGYYSHWFSLLTYKNSTAQLKVHILPNDYRYFSFVSNKAKNNNINIVFNKHTTTDGMEYVYNYSNENILHSFHNELTAELGSPINVILNVTTKKYYDNIINPLNIFHYGYICYEHAAKPYGREAIEHIVNDKSINSIHVLLNIMKSGNPEGRIYAIEYLHKYNKSLSNSDKIIINKIVDLNIPIHSCNGCIVSKTTANKLVHHIK